MKSDGNVCHWYELAEACFGGGCGPFGCGITQCDAEVDAPPTDPPVADTNTDTDGPTVAPIITTTTSPTLAQTEPVTEAPVTNPPTVEQTTVSPTAPSVDCSTITDCEGCVAAGCAFAVGACLESCNVIADAACYSTDQPSFMDLSAQEICEIQMNAVADAAACSQGTDCESCVSITLSDPESTCFWRASDNVCSATACDQTGACGVSTCDAGPDALCQAAGSDCATCLEASCAWLSQTQTCVPSCDVATNGDNCFSSEVFPQSNNQDICEAAVTSPEDTVLCFDQTDCESCITTEKEDGTFCEWYMDEETNIQWCQTVRIV